MTEDLARAVNDAVAHAPHPLFDWRSPESIRAVAWMDGRVREILERGKKLLDLGCGSGKHTYKAESMGLISTGIDISEAMIGFARRNKVTYGAKAEFVTGSYFSLPFPGSTFDYALFPKNIIECSYAEFELLANETARVLRPGGKFILTLKDETAEPGVPYDESGRYDGTIEVPGAGPFPYPTYRWTVSLVRRHAGDRFRLVDNRPIGGKARAVLLVLERSSPSDIVPE